MIIHDLKHPTDSILSTLNSALKKVTTAKTKLKEISHPQELENDCSKAIFGEMVVSDQASPIFRKVNSPVSPFSPMNENP